MPEEWKETKAEDGTPRWVLSTPEGQEPILVVEVVPTFSIRATHFDHGADSGGSQAKFSEQFGSLSHAKYAGEAIMEGAEDEFRSDPS